jgi:cytochrome c biogenesis protein CcmG/thiol:disulfide interchange protein DsbE
VRILWVLAVLAVAGILGALGWGLLHPATTPSSSVVGRPAPNLTVLALDGRTVTLSTLRGRPVVVNFWASWCAACHQEEAALEQAAQHWQGSVQFIGVDFKDSPQAARAYQQRARYPYPVGPGTQDPGAAYGVTAPPETFFINREGVVAARFLGPLDPQAIDRYLQLVGVPA